MNKDKNPTLSIQMDLGEGYKYCRCEFATTEGSESVIAALLASAVVSIAHGHSHDPHKFAEAVCGTIMEFIDKPGFTKPNQQLS